MSGQNLNAPHRPHFVRAGTYDITLTVARLFEVVPVEGQGREANASEATVFATVTSDGNLKVCGELTRFAGHVTRVGGPYTRTVRFVMEQDGMLALTALHDAMTVFEWVAFVKPVEDLADRIEAAIASGAFEVRLPPGFLVERQRVIRLAPNSWGTAAESRHLWTDTDVRRFFRGRMWVLIDPPAQQTSEPDPTTLQRAAELGVRAKQALKEAEERNAEAIKARDAAAKDLLDARRFYREAVSNLMHVAGVDDAEGF